MPPEINFTEADYESVLSGSIQKVPTKTGIFKGARFSLSTKVGGRMQRVMVYCKDGPYLHEMANGKTAWYVEVFGYGVHKRVNIKRLREFVK